MTAFAIDIFPIFYYGWLILFLFLLIWLCYTILIMTKKWEYLENGKFESSMLTYFKIKL